MKTNLVLLILAVFFASSCQKSTVSNVSASNSTSPANIPTNSNTNTSINLSNNANSTTSQTNSQVNIEMLKQIEAQQLETADPRKAANKSVANKQSSAPKKGSSQHPTW